MGLEETGESCQMCDFCLTAAPCWTAERSSVSSSAQFLWLHCHMVLVTALAPLLTLLPLHSCVTVSASFSMEKATSCFCENKMSQWWSKRIQLKESCPEHSMRFLACPLQPLHQDTRSSCIKSCRHAEEDTRLSDCQLSGDKSHALSDSAPIISLTAVTSCTLIEFEL